MVRGAARELKRRGAVHFARPLVTRQRALLASFRRVSKGKLTRQELGWLLTQEAQGAAERLRKGVTALTQAPPPPGTDASGRCHGVDATLSALDDAMRMLSSLHNRPSNIRGRRGRIDLASLLWEVAPEARVSIEPGSGTEVTATSRSSGACST